MLLASAFVMSGCGDDAGSSDAGSSEDLDAGSSGDADAADSAPREPRYVVSSTVFTADSPTAYLTVVDSLAAGPTIDLDDSLEFSGDSRAYGPEGADVVYVTSDEDGTMTEVTFEANGSLKIGRKVSFTNYGISRTTGGNVHYFVAPTKAYFVSQQTLEIIVWNPREMEIITTIPLELLPADGESVAFYPRPILVDDQLVLISNTYDENDIADSATVTVVDTREDSVASSTTETRCHNLVQSAVDAEGDRYFASGSLSVAMHFLLPEQAPAPCMLRMRAGETSFDPDWSRSFTEELGTGLWTGVTQGMDGKLYIQSMPEDAPEVVAAAGESDPFGIANAQAWTWHALSDASAEPVALDTDFLSAPPVFAPIPVGKSAYVSLWDGADTTLIDLASAATPRKGVVVPGFVYNVVKIR